MYRLSEPVIAELSDRGSRKRSAILDDAEQKAERAFHHLCESYAPDVVGVWDGRRIHYPLFDSIPSPPPFAELMREAKWDQFGPLARVESEARNLTAKMDADRHQQLAYAGVLTFDDRYRSERDRLIELARTISGTLSWPLYASTCDEAVLSANASAPTDVATFFDELARFLRKYNLAGLVTWDLPLPQGPLEGVMLNLARHLLGPNEPVNKVPTYYDIPSNVNVRAEIQKQQRREARQRGIQGRHPVSDPCPLEVTTPARWRRHSACGFLSRPPEAGMAR